MLAWRGKEELTVGKLLVCLWQKEEAHMAVSRDSNGGISGKLGQYINNGLNEYKMRVFAFPYFIIN